MDIDRHDLDYEEPEDDDDDREAPSEQDTDEAASRGENDYMKAHSECESIHTLSSPRDFGTSPMHSRVLDFAASSQATGGDHVTLLAEEPAEEPYHEVYPEGAHDDEDNARDEDEHESGEEVNEVIEEDLEEAGEEKQEEDQEVDHEAVVKEYTNTADADKHAPEFATTSQPASPSHCHESGDLPLPSPPKPKASKRGKHKDRQSRRDNTRTQEPAITKSVLEDKIVGILSKTLPNMLSGLLQEAMGLSRIPTSQQAPQSAPIVEVAIGSAEPETMINEVVATQEVGVQGMEVDHMDGATHVDASPTTMDTDNAEANVRI